MLRAVRSVMWQAAAMSRRRLAGSRAMTSSTRAWLVRKPHFPACSFTNPPSPFDSSQLGIPAENFEKQTSLV